MAKEKAADEIFCRSCGEAIKEAAEICPECGVKNETASSQGNSTPTAPSTRTHDPSDYKTTVSDSWYYGVAGGTILWAFVFLLAAAGANGGAAVGLLAVVAWVGLPIATYFDITYVRANSQWNPNTVVWMIAMAVWFVNVVAGALYLYRRHEVLGEP